MSKIKYFFLAIRYYSLPMSILCSLMAFLTAYKTTNANVFYGFLATAGVILIHIGVNLFDDVIDTCFKVPKQGYKTKYLDDKVFNLKQIIFFTTLFFLPAIIIGCFFLYKLGFELLYVIIPTIIIALIYPISNNFAMGEIFIGLAFGPLLFEGIYYVMTNSYSKISFLSSIIPSILVSFVAFVHSLMDIEFDKQSGKFTLAILFEKIGIKFEKLNGQNFLKNFMMAQNIFIIYSLIFIILMVLK